jgi:secreted trypsin-like serine protease
MRRWLSKLAAVLLVLGGTHQALGQTAPPVIPGKVTSGGKPLKPFIVGPGFQPASSAQFGSVVAIYYKLADRETYLCTGTLLTDKLILTAGHCGCGFSYSVNSNATTHFDDPNQLQLDGPPILFDQRTCREGYLGGGNDLALLRLRNAVDLGSANATQQPSDLSTGIGYFGESVWNLRSMLTRGMSLQVIGYGYTSANVLGVRGKGDIPIYSVDCVEAALASICAPLAEMILAQTSAPGNRTDTCGGDSGGPVFWMQDGLPRLIAVTSRAAPFVQDNAARNCGGGGIYTLLGRASVQQWFEANSIPRAP